MYDCVSDRVGPRLSTWLLRKGIFGRWRSSWTIPQTSRPGPWYLRTCRYKIRRPNRAPIIHSYMIVLEVWSMEEILSSHAYIRKPSKHALSYSVYMFVWMYVLVIFFANYFDSFSLSRLGWAHSSHHIGSEWSQRVGGSPTEERSPDRGLDQCKEMSRS